MSNTTLRHSAVTDARSIETGERPIGEVLPIPEVLLREKNRTAAFEKRRAAQALLRLRNQPE
jgi:hypothetical protein